jgi:hypothetical protein
MDVHFLPPSDHIFMSFKTYNIINFIAQKYGRETKLLNFKKRRDQITQKTYANCYT